MLCKNVSRKGFLFVFEIAVFFGLRRFEKSFEILFSSRLFIFLVFLLKVTTGDSVSAHERK